LRDPDALADTWISWINAGVPSASNTVVQQVNDLVAHITKIGRCEVDRLGTVIGY
jgi:hypothetical protein